MNKKKVIFYSGCIIATIIGTLLIIFNTVTVGGLWLFIPCAVVTGCSVKLYEIITKKTVNLKAGGL